MPNMVTDVGPVKAGDDQAVVGNAELREDVGARARRWICPARRNVGMIVEQRPELAVVRPEVMAPLD